ncbi:MULTISPECIES: putative quinol monooxygenase [Chryseobacterium]|uniref:Quinol monooxygenase YgiN n=1 Tax=Chryseobacterium camelliae TaxID=1265445 RepID=A0ABU0THM3_9FLAO|nr:MULTISPECIES: putative quinol monooxygenase [Chryseobacterium]MDT3409592.1 quinol monooxygenase YgiN [Pseudacidovorax intermedius]MDQ1096548.1 quinol monooxygenase YgiN [Chryseobacterium camelliae]MDQ1100489.1 quinol monooxygenase YgiN [Chryseobacterium sp. SORGH_AS_1048]MDR6087829.1 quinol monooxygenase YgiN [Chryseobacterium sp. SORGH_AS_0909]MDR6132205.1 quinol monooxygenase YgiN [Chryseobacterium sp. SORGH_AS_1175]
MNLHIVALFKFNESDLMEAVELFQNLVKETRKEEGCLQYDLIEDKDNKGTFFLIELWETVEHHNRHNGQDHLLNFRRDAARIMESSIQVYKGFRIY